MEQLSFLMWFEFLQCCRFNKRFESGQRFVRAATICDICGGGVGIALCALSQHYYHNGGSVLLLFRHWGHIGGGIRISATLQFFFLHPLLKYVHFIVNDEASSKFALNSFLLNIFIKWIITGWVIVPACLDMLWIQATGTWSYVYI